MTAFLHYSPSGIEVFILSTRLMCKEDEEFSSHLFLHCTFARAYWHRSTLGLHTSNLRDSSVQIWISNILINFKSLEQDMMRDIHTIFTYLWTIWNHRNLVTHEGKTPKPIEVILIAQSLSYRFQEAYTMANSQQRKSAQPHSTKKGIKGPWELIIKIIGARKRRIMLRCWVCWLRCASCVVLCWLNSAGCIVLCLC